MPKGSLSSIEPGYALVDKAGVRVGADVAAIRAIFQTWGLGL
jgi:hypothetical protein